MKIDFTCSEEQKTSIEEKAAENGLSVASYCKFCALNAKIDIKVGVDPAPQMLIELRLLFSENLITSEEFKILKKKIMAGSGRRAMEDVEK